MIDAGEKLAGLLIPVFALRREGDLGIGDTQAVAEAVDFCTANNASVLQLLPINETGGDNSPYNAISSVALDPVLLTVAPNAVPGLTESMIEQIAPPAVRSRLGQGAVQYRQVKRLKLRLLDAAFHNFQPAAWPGTGSGSDLAEFDRFCREQKSWLESYCLFRTLIDVHHGDANWPSWDEPLRKPESAKIWIAQQADAAKLIAQQKFYAFVQWVASKQWAELRRHADKQSVRLMGDIPFGVSRLSADVWSDSNQELFDLDWSGGAPPERCFQGDPFTSKWGQNWGLPLYRWEAHEKTGFTWWQQRVRKVTEIFHYFRIDHVLGFFRIYSFPWIPERNGEFLHLSEDEARQKTGGRLPQFMPRSDAGAEDAAANAAQGEALLRMILSTACGAGVVAEDLGMVPAYVRPILNRLGIPGFTIPYWERTPDQELLSKDRLPGLSLATYATHDHMPLVQLYQDMVKRWLGPDGHEGWLEMQRFMRFLGLPDDMPPREYTPQLHECFIKTLMDSPCWLVILMITELLATSQRFNQPGTSGESNWSLRLDHPLSWYEHNLPFQPAIATFSRLVREHGRLPYARLGTIRKGKEGNRQ